MHEVASDREQRRSQQGYSTPAQALSLSPMARQARRSPLRRRESIRSSPCSPFEPPMNGSAAGGEARRLGTGLRQEPARGQRRPPGSARGRRRHVAEAGPDARAPRALLEGEHRSGPCLAAIRDADRRCPCRRRATAFLRVEPRVVVPCQYAGGRTLASSHRPFTPKKHRMPPSASAILGPSSGRRRCPASFCSTTTSVPLSRRVGGRCTKTCRCRSLGQLDCDAGEPVFRRCRHPARPARPPDRSHETA